MKAATVKQIKDELNTRTPQEVLKLCLRLSVFKKENKELLTYLLFEADDEESFIRDVKAEVDELFDELNTARYYLAKKGLRKILRGIKKYIRYSKNKETEVELLLYFCLKISKLPSSIRHNTVIFNLYNRQLAMIEKKIPLLHEDLQYDYGLELSALL